MTELGAGNYPSIYEKSSSGIINIRPKKWDNKYTPEKVGMMRKEWD